MISLYRLPKSAFILKGKLDGSDTPMSLILFRKIPIQLSNEVDPIFLIF